MRGILPVFLLIAALFARQPFWETSPPSAWTAAQLDQILTDSPWAGRAVSAGREEGVRVLLATALPIRLAEEELARRAPTREQDTEPGEYREFLKDNQGQCIVLAVELPAGALEDPNEEERMQEECVLRVGRKTFKLIGHFPPAADDPWLRLAFPRALSAADRSFRFELYLPGIPSPYRTVEFRVNQLLYKGTPEY